VLEHMATCVLEHMATCVYMATCVLESRIFFQLFPLSYIVYEGTPVLPTLSGAPERLTAFGVRILFFSCYY
jgi:hypothetical protein